MLSRRWFWQNRVVLGPVEVRDSVDPVLAGYEALLSMPADSRHRYPNHTLWSPQLLRRLPYLNLGNNIFDESPPKDLDSDHRDRVADEVCP